MFTITPPSSPIARFAAFAPRPDGLEIEVDLVVPGLLRRAQDRPRGPVLGAPDVVDPDRELPELSNGGVCECLDLVDLEEVRRACQRRAARDLDLLGDRLNLVRSPGSHDDGSAGLSEPDSDTLADAAP